MDAKVERHGGKERPVEFRGGGKRTLHNDVLGLLAVEDLLDRRAGQHQVVLENLVARKASQQCAFPNSAERRTLLGSVREPLSQGNVCKCGRLQDLKQNEGLCTLQRNE